MFQLLLPVIRFERLARPLVWRRGALAFALLGAAAFAFTLHLLAPGYLGTDSGVQLEQARTLAYSDWHPVLMAMIWHYTDQVLPGPLGMLVLMAALHWFGLALLFWALPGPLLARAAGLLALGFFPPVFSGLPMIVKDMLMQTTLMAGLALLVAGGRARWLRGLLALLLFVIALGARHNAVAAVWPLLALPLLAAPVLRARPAALRLLLACSAGFACAVTLNLGLAKALDPLSEKEEVWQTIAMFDLAGISLETGQILIESRGGFFTDGMTLDELRSRFNPEYSLALMHCLPFRDNGCAPAFRRSTDLDALDLLRDNWRRVVLAHPAAYLAHRAKVALPLLGLVGGPACIFCADGTLRHPLAADYPIPKRTMKLLQWFDSHVQALWFRPWPYVACAIILLPFALLAYARQGAPLPLLLLFSGFSYLASVVIATGTSEIRYCIWTILCTLLAAISLISTKLASSR